VKPSVAVPLTIAGVSALAMLTLIGVAVNFFSRDPILRDVLTWAGRLWAGFCGAAPLLVLAVAVIGARNFARWARVRAIQVHYRRGLLPASADPRITFVPTHDNVKAQIAQAVFDGKVDRANGSGMRALLAPRPDEEILQLADPAQPLTANEVLAGYDPQREPHWLLIGQTGSGKSHGVFAITQAIAQRYNSQFLVAERGGIDWNSQADARTIEGYATLLDTVEQERQRRGELMRAADVDHISGLRERLPLLVIVIEEAESIYGRLFELDRTRAKQFVQTLRDLASLGRKQGIALVIATQTGTSGVFDAPTRRNLGHTLIFRSEAIVGDQFGVPRATALASLPSGSAYALKYGTVVEFPLSSRPRLPHSPLYHEDDAPLLLAADAEADGLGDEDLPDGATDGTWYTVQTTPPPVGRYTGIVYRVPGQNEPLVDYDETLHRRLWEALRNGSSLKGAQDKAQMGYTGGTGFYLARAVRDLGQRQALPWERT
jgi:hypothetical protein